MLVGYQAAPIFVLHGAVNRAGVVRRTITSHKYSNRGSVRQNELEPYRVVS